RVKGCLHQCLRWGRRRPKFVALALILLALGGLAAYAGGGRLWLHFQRRAVQQALERRDFAEARVRLTRCLHSWPRDPELHLLAARAARRDGAYAEAGEHLEHCRRLGGDEDALTLERAMLIAQEDDPGRVEGFL